MGRLTGKVAIISGAARGIGRASALRFAQEGAHLALCDLNEAGVAETASLARQYGVNTYTQRVDVSSRTEVEAFVTAVVAQLGGVHVLMNNAGIFFNAPFESMTDDQYQRMMDINVKSVFLMTQAVIRHWLITDQAGSIINLASLSASIAFMNSSAYCMAKAAVASLTRCVALEYGARGIRANSMAPGIIDTAMLPSAEDSANWAKNRIPLRRMGQPEDVADLALFLASDESRYITGDMIYVDGGWMLE